MKRLTHLGIMVVFTAFGVLLVAPAGIMASQQAANGQSALTLNQVKQRLKQNQQYIKQAEKRGNAGDTAGMETALTKYDRGMEGLNTALSEGQIQGSSSQQENAYNRVQTATAKHLRVLNGLLNKVPAQAVPNIQHAIDVSQMGQKTALSHLTQLQTQTGLGQGNNSGFGRSEGSAMGHPGGIGAANSPMGGPMGMGDSMGHQGGGPPMGGHPGR
jgi:hypothetical protein